MSLMYSSVNEVMEGKMEVKIQGCKALFVAEDKIEMKRYAHCDDVFNILWEMLKGKDSICDKLNHGHDFKTADEALEWCRDALFRKLEEEGVNLEELWR